jgi:hypothetical protein
MQIEQYRPRLEQFHHDLNQELYLHYSGRKENLETAGLYSDFSDLFSLETIREIQSEIDRLPSNGSRKKTFAKLRAFAVEHHLEHNSQHFSQEIAALETKSAISWDGRKICVTQVPLYLANEPDALGRRRLNELRAQVIDGSNSLRRERLATMQTAARALGYRHYVEAREQTTALNYTAFLASVQTLVERTEDLYHENLSRSFQRDLGLSLPEAHRCDLPYWTRLNDYDHVYHRERMLPILFESLGGLGIDPTRQDAISFDLEERPLKHPRAFCAPLRIPQDIRIVLQPRAGQDGFSALLHESGHAQHFAFTSPSLPAEDRLCGDRGLAETYGFLLEQLQCNEVWLKEVVGFAEPAGLTRFRTLARAHLVRRHCAKLSYELSLYGEGLENAPKVYADTLSRATGLQCDPQSYLADAEDGLDSAGYLRAWIFELQLRDYLRSRFGNTWFAHKAAGRFLKEIWETGQLYSVDELCREIGLGQLEPQVLTDDLISGLLK